MPSVEYQQTDLITETVTREFTDPDSGETVTSEIEEIRNPFEVRISKWLKRNDGYHLYGFVEATGFGQSLASQSVPWTWLNGGYTVADGLTQTDVSEMVTGVTAVLNSQLADILVFGNVSPIDATVTSESANQFDFEIVLSSAETFDIDWLAVDFDPNRSGT
jgi:hypothetical protein